MGIIFYFCFSLILAVLFVLVLRLQGVQKFSQSLLLLVIAALVYDNGITAMGFLIGEGLVLKALSIPRFVLHAFVTPLICIIAYELARQAQVSASLRRAAPWAVWGLTAALMVAGFLQELAPMDFVPRRVMGVLTYSHSKPEPPLAAIAVNFFAIACSILIWRRTRWPVLFITSLLMLLLGGFPQKYFGLIPGNAGEIIFIAGFIFALKRFGVAKFSRN